MFNQAHAQKYTETRRKSHRPFVTRLLPGILPKTLLGRSLLIVMTPLVLLQVISTWFFYETHWQTLTKRLTASVAGDIGLVIYMLQQTEQHKHNHILAAAEELTDLRFAIISGQILPISLMPTRSNPVDNQLGRYLENITHRAFLIDSRSLEKEVEVRLEMEKPNGVLQVFIPRRRLFSSTTYVFILWMIGSSVVLFTVATIFMRRQTKPVGQLAYAAEEYGKGRDYNDFQISGASEVQKVGLAFRRMRDRIKRQTVQRVEMLAGVSHDLRTPLTRMRLQLAMIPETASVHSLLQDIDEMTRMIDGYLAFARGEGTEKARMINLSRLIDSVIENCKRQHQGIDSAIHENIILPIRPDAMRRCLSNLLDNARCYASKSWVQAFLLRHVAHIIIDDNGPGIPAEQRQNVFKPFFRLAQDVPNNHHMGLGLTIARDIVHNHGGQLELLKSPQGGLRVHIKLPI